MFVRIDHIMICVRDLAQGMAQYRKMGFNIYEGGNHPGRGTHNAIAFNTDDYIELLAIRDMAEQRRAAAESGGTSIGLPEFIAAGGGIRYIVLQSDDLAADVAAMRGRGVDVSDVSDGARKTPAEQELKWRYAYPGPGNPLPLFFIQHVTSVEARRKTLPIAGNHPNGAYAIERAYIVTPNVESDATVYAKVLGVPKPSVTRGTVVMANMAVFQVGQNGLGVVEPYAPGPASKALESRGPGPFQALYRTASMGAATRWMQEHGMPPLERGVRNTGEIAMLVPPSEACGTNIGFVGPE